MSIYALAKVCMFKFRHCKRFVTAKCVDKQCSWRVMSKQLAEVRKQYKKHGTSRVLAALLRSKYERLQGGPRAMELPEILRTEFNYTCTYWKAWKAKELAIASAQGTEEMSYKILPQYFHKHLRKVLVVDGTHMFGKYKGVLLSSSGQDADCRAFPIAFAVVDSENSDSWKWFFERCAAIFAANDRWYPRAHHGICLEHLKRNVAEKYKRLQQKDMVASAGEAFKVSKFEKLYELIKLTDWRCWDYLEKIHRKLWKRSHFEGKRYNMMTSNIAESLNHTLLPARESPIVALMEFIRRMLTRWFESRHCKISKMTGIVPKLIKQILVEQLVLSTGLLVLPCSTWVFEVTHKATVFGFSVDLKNELAPALNSRCSGCHADML
ncbi:uncharacterized protein LOC106398802 [Brassica napus]|uniref:uncharacterized protein LOC106398802 n=1 Tax=Brassica napus TaxID=3708 RepID=UPI0006AB51E2|nr:uncharacterized protein LOC106398802 [Brassica napus]